MLKVWRVKGWRGWWYSGVRLMAEFDRCFAVRGAGTEAAIRWWLMNRAAESYVIDVEWIDSVVEVCDVCVWDVR